MKVKLVILITVDYSVWPFLGEQVLPLLEEHQGGRTSVVRLV
jgi:hypothetical protein